jgi:ABC-type nitrate/sulfonate/bicarbonate transport system ATPase subunit
LAKRIGEYPDNLSGGERQRAAIARAFSFPAPILLMDEPFQSQDPAQKAQLIDLVLQLQAEEKRTIISVTHDVREATALADYVIVLNGKPAQIILSTVVSSNLEGKIAEVLSCQTAIQ